MSLRDESFTTRILSFIFIFSVFCLGSAPWILSTFWDGSELGRLMFKPFCHQRIERSLVILEHPMVVCSRCAGIYSGMILGSLFAWPMRNFPWFRTTIIFAIVFMLLEVITQELQLHDIWHVSRFISGILLAFFFVSWVLGQLLLETTLVSKTE